MQRHLWMAGKSLVSVYLLTQGLSGCKTTSSRSQVRDVSASLDEVKRTFGPLANMVGQGLPDVRASYDRLNEYLAGHPEYAHAMCLDSLEGVGLTVNAGGGALAKVDSEISLTYAGSDSYELGCAASAGLNTAADVHVGTTLTRSIGTCTEENSHQLRVVMAAGPSAKLGVGTAVMGIYDVGIAKGVIFQVANGTAKESLKFFGQGILDKKGLASSVSSDTCSSIEAQLGGILKDKVPVPAYVIEALNKYLNAASNCHFDLGKLVEGVDLKNIRICEQLSLREVAARVYSALSQDSSKPTDQLRLMLAGLIEGLSGCDSVALGANIGAGISPGIEVSVSLKTDAVVGKMTINREKLASAVQQVKGQTQNRDTFDNVNRVAEACNGISGILHRGEAVCGVINRLDGLKDGIQYLPALVRSVQGELDAVEWKFGGYAISSEALPDYLELPLICGVRIAGIIKDTALPDLGK